MFALATNSSSYIWAPLLKALLAATGMPPHPGPTSSPSVSEPVVSDLSQDANMVYGILSGNLTSLSKQLAHVSSVYPFDILLAQEATVPLAQNATTGSQTKTSYSSYYRT